MRDLPGVVFAVSLTGLWLASRAGTWLCHRMGKLDEGDMADLDVVRTAALTLLGLVIGFTFSMAISHYDHRKLDEAAEANAIGTEFVRAGLLPPEGARRVRELLHTYLEQRVLFYTTWDRSRLRGIEAARGRTQADLWSTVEPYAAAAPTPITALVIAGANDVLNSQAYTQAAWWDRIPALAWVLMAAMAVCSSVLVGYTARRPEGHARRFFLLPLIVAISFFLIADIDSPRSGVIRVHPQNLESAQHLLDGG
jgi:hypothetical protein